MVAAAHKQCVTLNPGEYFVGDAHCRIFTLLGSCVAITLWHARLRLGGMTHFLLAATKGTRTKDNTLDGRFGEDAFVLMTDGLDALGAPLKECEAKLFGGGNMFPGPRAGGLPDIGRDNGAVARELLACHGIPLVAESLYGNAYRKVIFDIETGLVWLHQGHERSHPVTTGSARA